MTQVRPSNSKSHLADMSLPPELRGRKRKTRGKGKGATSQMSHGNGSYGTKSRREWFKRNKEREKARGQSAA